MIIDGLIEAILHKGNNPTAVGIDTDFSYLPDEVKAVCKTNEDAAKAILDFNVGIIDAVKDIVPAVKVQVAYYESYGVCGYETFARTLAYAKQSGLYTIADVKRNDIGATATAYSRAYFSGTDVNGKIAPPFESDFITLNGYLGSDGIKPFLKDCGAHDRGVFVLVKTSNPGSAELQDLALVGGGTVYEKMGEMVESWGADAVGKHGYHHVGAVVGATHPKQAEILRKNMPHTFFLIPGYGAQGGTADDLKVCFDAQGLGGIVNSSRGIICAYKQDKYHGMTYTQAARAACVDMYEDLSRVVGRRG